MKTIILQGDEIQMTNLAFALSSTDNILPKRIEIRVYVCPSWIKKPRNLTDDAFKKVAEDEGQVYNLEDFEEAFNLGDVSTEVDTIRIINVEV